MNTTNTPQIEFTCSFNGGFYITTDLELTGRGIKMSGNGSTHARGKKTYHVSAIAFDKLKSKYSVEYYSN